MSHDATGPDGFSASERLHALLTRIIEQPARRDELSEAIKRDFTTRHAVLLTDVARAALDPKVTTPEARASISGLTLVYHVLD